MDKRTVNFTDPRRSEIISSDLLFDIILDCVEDVSRVRYAVGADPHPRRSDQFEKGLPLVASFCTIAER